MQFDLFNAELGKDLRDLAIQRVGNKHQDWCSAALLQVYGVCKNYREFTTDDLWQHITPPSEPRAMGAVIAAARKRQWIEPTDRFRVSTRAICHRNPKRVWKSLI